MSEKLSIGLLGFGGKLVIDNGMLRYTHPYGKSFSVLLKDIDTVTLDGAGMGKVALKLIGRGAVLAEAEMPKHWGEKCQAWILGRTNRIN